MKCPACNSKMKVTDTRELSDHLENEHAYGCVKFGLSAGDTQGTVRERRCKSCGQTIYTVEIITHIKEKHTKFKL